MKKLVILFNLSNKLSVLTEASQFCFGITIVVFILKALQYRKRFELEIHILRHNLGAVQVSLLFC